MSDPNCSLIDLGVDYRLWEVLKVCGHGGQGACKGGMRTQPISLSVHMFGELKLWGMFMPARFIPTRFLMLGWQMKVQLLEALDSCLTCP